MLRANSTLEVPGGMNCDTRKIEALVNSVVGNGGGEGSFRDGCDVGWLSFRVPLEGQSKEEIDRIVVNVYREVEAVFGCCNVFYIRYWDYARHMRLRIRQCAVEDYRGAALRGDATATERGGHLGVDRCFNPPIEWSLQQYVPESLRYASVLPMWASESLFCLSSYIVAESLINTNTPLVAKSRRKGLSLAFSASVIKAALPDEKERKRFLCEMHDRMKAVVDERLRSRTGERYTIDLKVDQRTVSQLHQFMLLIERNDELNVWVQRAFATCLTAWRALDAQLSAAANSRDSPKSIFDTKNYFPWLISHLHMHNNRLGLDSLQELQAAKCLGLMFESQYY